jgi:V8-like Glu-specific endopeptidase
MLYERNALPFLPEIENETYYNMPQDEANKILVEIETKQVELLDELAKLSLKAERITYETTCGLTDDSQDVELYDGTLGVTRKYVDKYSPPVGQLQWVEDLSTRFSGPYDYSGNVAGVRWGSGGLIANDLFLTAGHCFDTGGDGWKRPRKDGEALTSEEIAVLMNVNFNYQLNGSTKQLRQEQSFPITELLEYRLSSLDFAIVRLGRDADGRLPGQVFGTLVIAKQDLKKLNTMLCMIQHPDGKPKKIEAGPLKSNNGHKITYDSIDTLGGSSGSPVLSPSGKIVGVHTIGGCSPDGGYNSGVAIGAIRKISTLI